MNQVLYEVIQQWNISHSTRGRLNPYLHWILDEQSPYAALLTDPVVFSCYILLSAITTSFAKKWYLKLISIVAASWFLIADWRDTNITVRLHNVSDFKAGYTSSDPKVCRRNQDKFLFSTTLGISWSQMWWRLFQPLHLFFTLFMFQHSICGNFCSKSGIGNMGHRRYG